MKLYADRSGYRSLQILEDLGIVAWVVVWVWIGMFVHDLIAKLAAPGRAVESAGRGLTERMIDISEEIGDVPVVGPGLRTPFEGAAGATRQLSEAGQGQQEAVLTLALWLGILFALSPVLVALFIYVPKRYRWIREATAADRIRVDVGDLELFALRALASRPLHELRRAHPDPAGAFASGDHAFLAELELTALGLKP